MGLLQQGGQLKDTFGGIGNAARALGGYVVSLINPFTLAAAAVGTLGYSYFQGSKELDEYRKALILTGNAVGLTGGQMQDMARSMAAVSGTQTAASEALVAFVNAGASGSDSLQKFAQSALNFSKVTGQAVEDIAKQFADLGKNPLEASVKLNDSTNFLTMSLYEQIKALDEQGKKTEAANVAQQAYSDTLNQNTAQITANLGTIEKGWNAIASATKGAWDWMKNVGRDDGPTQKLAKLQLDVVNAENNLKSAIASSVGGAASGKAKAYEKELQAAQDKLAEFNKTTALSQIRASDRGIEAQAVKDKIEWDKTHQSQLDKLQQSLHKEVEDYAKLKAAGKDDAQTRLQYEQRIHHLVKQEADYLKGEYKTELKTQKPKAESIDAFGKELTATKQWLATKERMIQDSYSTQQKSIEDAYKNQEISAAQFYSRQLANDEKALSDSEKVRAEAQARFDVEMAKRVAETKARPAGNDRTTALRDLAAESQNFAE
jgi:phage-related minor tail protein